MRQVVLWIMCLLVLISPVGWAVSSTITNPQTLVLGARGISLGGTPGLVGDISNAIYNPSTLSDIDQLPFSITNQSLFGHFDYLIFSTGFQKTVNYMSKNRMKRKKFGIGLSYANISLSKIPETIAYQSLPYQVGTYSAGYHLAHLGIATNYYNQLAFDKISVGAGFKFISQYISSYTASTVGFDAGFISKKYLDYSILDSVEFSGVFHNIITPALSFSESGNEGVFPLSTYFGTKVNLFNERLKIFSSLNDFGVNVGAEFEVEDGIYIRSSSDFDIVNFGAGLVIEDIPTMVSGYDIRGRFDFNYSQAAFPMNTDPTYVFTVASLGRAIPKQPEILHPDQPIEMINRYHLKLSGLGPKKTTIRVYNNNTFFRTTISNKNGEWLIKRLAVKEGVNQLYIQSYDLSKDFSVKSNEVTVIVDTMPPDLDVTIYPYKNQLAIDVESNEYLDAFSGLVDGKTIRFKSLGYIEPQLDKTNVEKLYLNPSRYQALADFPEALVAESAPPIEFSELQLYATDRMGNAVDLEPLPFFGVLDFPQDKHVHYESSLLALGQTSSVLVGAYVNNVPVQPDDWNQFSLPVDLNPGKNVLELKFETAKNQVLRFYSRILHLVSYPDMNTKVKGRREIEFLSTIGVMFGDDDGYFYPLRKVTRQYITQLMVLIMDETIEEEVGLDLFSDVSRMHPFAKYIQAGVNSGLIFAFPDGTFKPDQEITLTEVIYLLSNAGIINYEEVEDSDRVITRAELAEFLAYTPKFERKISRLIDWETGYDVISVDVQ